MGVVNVVGSEPLDTNVTVTVAPVPVKVPPVAIVEGKASLPVETSIRGKFPLCPVKVTDHSRPP